MVGNYMFLVIRYRDGNRSLETVLPYSNFIPFILNNKKIKRRRFIFNFILKNNIKINIFYK